MQLINGHLWPTDSEDSKDSDDSDNSDDWLTVDSDSDNERPRNPWSLPLRVQFHVPQICACGCYLRSFAIDTESVISWRFEPDEYEPDSIVFSAVSSVGVSKKQDFSNDLSYI